MVQILSALLFSAEMIMLRHIIVTSLFLTIFHKSAGVITYIVHSNIAVLRYSSFAAKSAADCSREGKKENFCLRTKLMFHSQPPEVIKCQGSGRVTKGQVKQNFSKKHTLVHLMFKCVLFNY